MNETNAQEWMDASDPVEELSVRPLDWVRQYIGHLEDKLRIAKAVLRERAALDRRNTGWKARRLAIVAKEFDSAG